MANLTEIFNSAFDTTFTELNTGSNESRRTGPKTVAFSGAAGNGAQGTVSLFTVTGAVFVSVIGICTENLAGATATIAIGVSGNTAGVIASTTATNITAGTAWVDNGPSTTEQTTTTRIIPNGQDIIATIATADITDGTISFYAFWRPISSDGNVVAA